MQNKLLQIIKTIVIILIIMSLFMLAIISQDTHHEHNCTVDNCYTCSIIKVAQILINLTAIVFINLISAYLIQFFLSRIHEKKLFFMQKSLVFQKVQMNE